ncbi:hypothetical protein BpHYR1_002574 [Brachionus plicatilis]|uniref:Uncharacterized protein n=1 Tax=Brachionus plicatilis TaxID=10195 RepID=A0A3M7RGI9_BRAPC|nr:hypothetical protein BpHYR1_002574 [Brachionus plicatilis]
MHLILYFLLSSSDFFLPFGLKDYFENKLKIFKKNVNCESILNNFSSIIPSRRLLKVHVAGPTH